MSDSVQKLLYLGPLTAAGERASGRVVQASAIHFAVLLMILCGSSFATFGTPFFWNVAGGLLLASLCAVHFAASYAILQRLRRIPRTAFFWHSVSAVLLSGAGLLVFLAITRAYYSRAFLLGVFAAQILWITFAGWLSMRGKRRKLGVISGGMTDKLLQVSGIEWVAIESPVVPKDCEGVVLDLEQPLGTDYGRFLAECCMRQIPVFHAAALCEQLTGRVSLDHIAKGHVEELLPSDAYRAFKRFMDVFTVLFTLPITLPVGLLVALAVRLDSVGPVLFFQERLGRGEKKFSIIKFRTMKFESTGEARFAEKNDSRLTRLGSFLRTYRLDELPQLWNILRGEMSLIGPRPEQTVFAIEFAATIPFYTHRHLIKPGLTGWAQIHLGYADSAQSTKDKLEYDLYYVKNAGLPLDFVVLLQTVRTVLTRYGAR